MGISSQAQWSEVGLCWQIASRFIHFRRSFKINRRQRRKWCFHHSPGLSVSFQKLGLASFNAYVDVYILKLSNYRFTKPKPKSEVRKRVNISEPRVSEVQPPSAVGSQQMSNPWASTNPEHAALMQQMYANYINQYMQYLQSMGVTPNWPPTATQSLIEHTNQINEEARQVPAVFDPVAAAAVAGAVANNLPADNVAQAAPVVHQDVQGQQPIGDAANLGNANVVMNAGGGAGGIAGAMEDEDDLNGGQRDILDWCYVVTRVLVLFSVVYFYSSLARYIWLDCFITLLQIRWFFSYFQICTCGWTWHHLLLVQQRIFRTTWQ